jgi:HK97 family phage portal protein
MIGCSVSLKSRFANWLLQDDEEEQEVAVKQVPPSISLAGVTPTGSPASYSPRNAKAYAQFGYVNNTTVFRAICIVAQSCASVDWKVYKSNTGTMTKSGIKKRTEMPTHPLAKLLEKPNSSKARSTFIEQLVSYWLITGSNYMLASFNDNTLTPGQTPLGLYNLRPDLVEQLAGANGDVATYRYDVGDNRYIDYPAWKVLALRFFHPLDELAGLSPIQVAAAVIERQNAGEEWNFHLMRNMARPSGAFVAQTEFSDEGRARMRREVQNKYGRGKQTAGMPMLLENGLSYIQLAINPVDADWFNSDAAAGRKIASAIGVDPLLLQDKQYSTYNNELEAKLAMWELTCFPLMEKLKDELNGFLVPFYGGGVEIDYDREPIESLKRNRQMESVTTIAEWNTGLRSFNQSASDFDLPTVADKDDFLRLGPTIFVRLSDISEFLDAQKKIWNPPPLPTGQPGQLQGPAKPPKLLGTTGNPSAGNIRVNKVPTNVIPLTPNSRQFRETWAEIMVKGILEYNESERQLLVHTHKTTKMNKNRAIKAIMQLQTSQFTQLVAGYYASVAMEAGKSVAAQFGEKFIFSSDVMQVLGEFAGKNILAFLQEREQSLDDILQAGDFAVKMREEYHYYQKNIESFARDQVVIADNVGRALAARQMQVPLLKTWVSESACHAEINGLTMTLDSLYDFVHVQFPTCECSEVYSLDLAASNPFAMQTVITEV